MHHGTTALLQMPQDWGTELSSVPLDVSPSVSVLLRQKRNISKLFEGSVVLFAIGQNGLVPFLLNWRLSLKYPEKSSLH